MHESGSRYQKGIYLGIIKWYYIFLYSFNNQYLFTYSFIIQYLFIYSLFISFVCTYSFFHTQIFILFIKWRAICTPINGRILETQRPRHEEVARRLKHEEVARQGGCITGRTIDPFDMLFNLHLFLHAATVIGRYKSRDFSQPIIDVVCKNK